MASSRPCRRHHSTNLGSPFVGQAQPLDGDGMNAYDLADGKVVELRFDLMPTAWSFRKGHRLRIAVAGADAGNFEMNPYLCSGNRPGDCPRTTISIKHTRAWPSRVELPVIPSTR